MNEEEEENSYGQEEEDKDKDKDKEEEQGKAEVDSNLNKENNETSILERHEKITNTISTPITPNHKSSFKRHNTNNNTCSNESNKVEFKTLNDDNTIQRKITSIKTDKDIQEDIQIESSHKEEDNNDNKNMLNHNEGIAIEPDKDKDNNNHQILVDLPQSFLNSVKYLKIKHQKEQLNAFMKFNKTPELSKDQQRKPIATCPNINMNPNTNTNKSINDGRSILKKNINNTSNDITNTTPLLPRIPSASNLSNQMTLIKPSSLTTINNSKGGIKLGIPYHRNRNTNLKPIPSEEDKHFIQLEKENKDLYNKLQSVNQQLNILISKRLRQKPELKTLDITHRTEIREIEINSMKKTLARLIDEYNYLSKEYLISKDTETKERLEEQLAELTKQYNDKLKANQDLQAKIKMNEYYLLNSKDEQESLKKNLTLLDAKNELYKKRLKEEQSKQERMMILIVKEEERIQLMKDKFNKLKEILAFYAETPESILNKDGEMIEKKSLLAKYEALKKKSNIMQHSRVSSSKTYQIDINNQKKDIDNLQKTIQEVNEILNSLN